MDFAERFEQLDAWLVHHQAVWRATPFTQHQLPWEQDWPELAAWLRSRSLAQAEQAHTELSSLAAPAPFAELLAQSQLLCVMPDWSVASTQAWPEMLERHIPGRKWQQITRFAQASQQRWRQPLA